jgi:gluconolactonase
MSARAFLVAASLAYATAASGSSWRAPASTPDATVDLTTTAGAATVGATWRYAEARVVESTFFAPGAGGQPSAERVPSRDIEPKAGARGFDDGTWDTVAPDALSARRGAGLFSLAWYRTRIKVPDRIGAFETRGSTIVFEVSVDDYAEVWVDGELTRGAAQSGGSVVAGWNAPNRLVIARNAAPGREIELAVFGMNGPISSSPTNYIWVREAKLDFYAGPSAPIASPPREVNVRIERKDPEMDRVIGHNPKVYKLAEGFTFTEGPIWVPEQTGGYLLFSDPNENTIYRYSPAGDGALGVFRTPSGYSGSDIAEYGQPGSNGLTLDADGRLTINEHGNRRVTRLERDGTVTTLVDAYEGKRLNSPNDLVYRSDGALYFTDPPFGLPKFFDDPRKELPFSGVYLLKSGKLTLLTKELSGPNGIALSPDERTLYVGNWDEKRKVVLAFDVQADGSVMNGRAFYDLTPLPGEDAIDGIKVDLEGRLYVSGPAGISVIAADGRYLGEIVTGAHAHNFAFGDADGKTLYLTAEHGLYKMRLGVAGVRPETASQPRR